MDRQAPAAVPGTSGAGNERTPGARRSYSLVTVLLLGLVAVAGGWLLYTCYSRPSTPRPAARMWPVAVSTLAGNGTPGRGDGFGSAAFFWDPFGVVVDAGGVTYVTDAGENNMVRRILPSGHVSVVAGGTEGWVDGTGSAARFHTPSGIALAPDGSLIVADTGNNAIRRVTPQGVVTTVAGGGGRGYQDGPALAALFDAPLGVAVARDGRILVADTYNDCVRSISREGTVTTVAGGAVTGYRDGAGTEARFDTPSGIAIDPAGTVFVADTGNNVVRRIDARGEVTTLGLRPGGETAPGEGNFAPMPQVVALWRPVGVAAARAGTLYVSDSFGRVSLFSADGSSRVIAGTTPGFADGAGAAARFNNPTGLAVDAFGVLRVADSDNYLVRSLTPPGVAAPARDIFLSALPLLSPAALGFEHIPWPIDPQEGWHEVTATLGEARGSVGGDGRERLHTGVDVHAPAGTIARAVHDEKVTRPIAANGYGDLNESVRVGLMSYVHVKAGRDARDGSLDPSRFEVLYDENGFPTRVRVRRGTRFAAGDAIGSVNRFAHVHLNLGPPGGEVNLLRFALAQFTDHVAPTIPARGILLFDEWGTRFEPPRRGPVEVRGKVSIVVEAWDQVDRNMPRRRLGVHGLGYQVLRRAGSPAPAFEEPRMTMRFDRLPQTPRGASVVYAEGSGITVYGNRSTRFRYIVTNDVDKGEARPGWWDTSTLEPGDYRLRVIATDIAGNTTTREIPVRVAFAGH